MPFAPLITHGVGMFVAWLVVKLGVELTEEQRAGTVSFLTQLVSFAVMWIGIHLGLSIKLNPTNAASRGAIEEGRTKQKARKAARKGRNDLEARVDAHAEAAADAGDASEGFVRQPPRPPRAGRPDEEEL